MKLRCVVASFAALLLLECSTASAGDPWNLHCASTPAELPAPRAVRVATLAYFPWVRPAAKTLHFGPIYLVAGSSRTAIARDGDATDSSGYYLHRALIAVAPRYTGPVTLTGHRLGRSTYRAGLGFSTNGATACTVNARYVTCGTRPLRFSNLLDIKPHIGWRIVQTELRIGRTGCYTITATGHELHAVIPLSVPGPDYGTPGW